MFANLSADTDLIRAYGCASAGHAADLQSIAARLSTLGAMGTPMTASAHASMFGPVGARFRAALTRAAEREAQRVADLGASVASAHQAASSTAQAYAVADADAGSRITGHR